MDDGEVRGRVEWMLGKSQCEAKSMVGVPLLGSHVEPAEVMKGHEAAIVQGRSNQ